MSTPVGRVAVNRCVCLGRSFADLLPLARAGGWDLARLSAETGCGSQCGLCRPYLRRMLSTGETVIHEVLVEPPGA